jgi:hypothetical protein
MAINDTPHQRGFTAVDRTETISGTPRADGRVSYQLLEIPLMPIAGGSCARRATARSSIARTARCGR